MKKIILGITTFLALMFGSLNTFAFTASYISPVPDKQGQVYDGLKIKFDEAVAEQSIGNTITTAKGGKMTYLSLNDTKTILNIKYVSPKNIPTSGPPTSRRDILTFSGIVSAANSSPVDNTLYTMPLAAFTPTENPKPQASSNLLSGKSVIQAKQSQNINNKTQVNWNTVIATLLVLAPVLLTMYFGKKLLAILFDSVSGKPNGNQRKFYKKGG